MLSLDGAFSYDLVGSTGGPNYVYGYSLRSGQPLEIVTSRYFIIASSIDKHDMGCSRVVVIIVSHLIEPGWGIICSTQVDGRSIDY